MRIQTLSHSDVANPLYKKLVSGNTLSAPGDDGPCDLFVVDAASCAPDEIGQAVAALDAGAKVLLLDAGDEHKKALAKRIGFRSHGPSRGYLVARLASKEGHARYRIVEVGEDQAPVTCASQAVAGDRKGATKVFPSQPGVPAPQQGRALTDAEMDVLLAAITAAAAEDEATDSAPEGLDWASWIYSRSHSYTASGSVNSDTGLGPPPSQQVTLLLTYTFQAALNDPPQSGAFQYVGLSLSGIFQNNGMSNTDDDNYGWILAAIEPTFSPSSSLAWYSSSPSNTNDATQVTTGSSVNIGFNSNGATGGYTYSSSVTNNITDWYITQETSSNWLYAQNTPFDGNTTSASVADSCVNWYSGHINTSSFPTISTSSLQFATNTVWKTSSVLTSEVDISVNNRMQVDYMMVKEFMGLGTNFVLWYSSSTPTDSFSIDLSVVS
ncbi:MAG: hypothetical protein QM820_12880 [Minicystis sp.]